MKMSMMQNLVLGLSLLLVSSIGFSQENMSKPLTGVENTKAYKTIDLIYMDKDLSIFANLLTLSGLDASLKMTDRDHTLFIPTNEAFEEMSIEKFAELTNPENRAMLVDFVNRHFTGMKIDSGQLTKSKILDLDNNERIEISEVGNTVYIGGATVVASDIETANGVVHVVNDVIKISK